MVAKLSRQSGKERSCEVLRDSLCIFRVCVFFCTKTNVLKQLRWRQCIHVRSGGFQCSLTIVVLLL
jgi:hypothetical protein